MNECPARWPG